MKKFVISILLFFLPIILLVANYLTLSSVRECSGDLGKMAKFFFEKGYHEKFSITPDSVKVQDIEIKNLPNSPKILCFGDSFSNKRPLCFLQPVAEHFGTNIINVLYNLNFSPEDAAIGFLSNAPLSQMPEIMIVECVERYCIPKLYWLDTDNPPSLEQLQKGKKHSTSTQKKSIDKEILLYYQYRLGKENNTICTRLDRQCFTAEGNEEELFSYYEDTVHYSDEYISGAAQKLEKLHQLATVRNVTLIYMIAPNKSTLYTPYCIGPTNFFSILNNNTTFDTIPYVFNPLSKLRQFADNGVKDIYYADDTHWTPATAQIIGTQLTSKIIKLLTTNNSND